MAGKQCHLWTKPHHLRCGHHAAHARQERLQDEWLVLWRGMGGRFFSPSRTGSQEYARDPFDRWRQPSTERPRALTTVPAGRMVNRRACPFQPVNKRAYAATGCPSVRNHNGLHCRQCELPITFFDNAECNHDDRKCASVAHGSYQPRFVSEDGGNASAKYRGSFVESVILQELPGERQDDGWRNRFRWCSNLSSLLPPDHISNAILQVG